MDFLRHSISHTSLSYRKSLDMQHHSLNFVQLRQESNHSPRSSFAALSQPRGRRIHTGDFRIGPSLCKLDATLQREGSPVSRRARRRLSQQPPPQSQILLATSLHFLEIAALPAGIIDYPLQWRLMRVERRRRSAHRLHRTSPWRRRDRTQVTYPSATSTPWSRNSGEC